MTEDAFRIGTRRVITICELSAARIPSTNSKRAYAQTFAAWLTCVKIIGESLNLDDIKVSAYLVSKQVFIIPARAISQHFVPWHEQ